MRLSVLVYISLFNHPEIITSEFPILLIGTRNILLFTCNLRAIDQNRSALSNKTRLAIKK